MLILILLIVLMTSWVVIARLMETYTTGTVKNVNKHGLTKGEQQVDWAEGRAQQQIDEAREAGVFDDIEPEFATGGRVSAQPPKIRTEF